MIGMLLQVDSKKNPRFRCSIQVGWMIHDQNLLEKHPLLKSFAFWLIDALPQVEFSRIQIPQKVKAEMQLSKQKACMPFQWLFCYDYFVQFSRSTFPVLQFLASNFSEPSNQLKQKENHWRNSLHLWFFSKENGYFTRIIVLIPLQKKNA